TRFYTYVSTMGNAMQAAAEHGLRFVVLDRPNPVNGVDVQGPVLDDGAQSFVGFHTVPVRHGMTIGELALMFRTETNLTLDLQIIRVEGWDRSQFFDATGLPWVNPSPNMRCLTQAVLYPGIGLIETTNVSVGRGTDTPFEIVGAPFINGRELAAELNAASLSGVCFVPIRFRPASSRFEGELCEGVNIVITDRSAFDPLQTGLELAVTLRRLYPVQWETRSLDRLLNDRQSFDAIVQGRSRHQIMRLYSAEREEFLRRRALFLLY
ncbi:MAG: DUF1343 domain-containing protein, partial [Planctomycetaceae bacterium]|nr:DUF1343 domain-containing protein [Planctomycetaceae bacterium]